MKNISHEEIAQKFVDGKAFDFNNIGKVITDLAPMLTVSDKGLHGVLFGKFNVLACMMPAYDAANFLGALRGGGLAGTIAEGVGEPR
ncbi:MAG: hypothetical protein WA849_13300 [Candidatus Udaeobacter sp.]